MAEVEHHFIPHDREKCIQALGKERLISSLERMLLIRNFELRAESAYQHGKIGGFFHAYMGQEAIQTAAIDVLGIEPHWWITTYRCHALPILMGEDIKPLMAELYGKATGNALGRGGSMHLYSKRMLGGFGIVGGHVPVATGAAFSLQYQKEDGAALCFLGDGAVAQGAFHESMNLASLWNLPMITVIENNKWGMGTNVSRAIAAQPIAEHFAKAYEMPTYTMDGMDYFSCYEAFSRAIDDVRNKGRPVLMEAVTERFRGHSISDPALYRTKEELHAAKSRDPIHLLSEALFSKKLLTEKEYEELNEVQKTRVLEAMQFADESPFPDPAILEDDVFAPGDE